jgi:microcystin-dependent protein
MFAGNFAPNGWMFCDGQLLPISENETLFQLIGTTYGGDGDSTFALPNLQSRVPIHWGAGVILAESGGVESVTLTTNQIPIHSHPAVTTHSPSQATSPQGNLTAQSSLVALYTTEDPNAPMAGTAVSPVGGNQPHENLQPYLCINFIISLFGIFPSQT